MLVKSRWFVDVGRPGTAGVVNRIVVAAVQSYENIEEHVGDLGWEVELYQRKTAVVAEL